MACATTLPIVMRSKMLHFLSPKGEQSFVTLGSIVCSVAIYLVMALAPAPLASLLCLVKAHRLLTKFAHSWVPHANATTRRSRALLCACIAAFSILRSYLQGNPVIQNIQVWPKVLAVAS